VSGALILRNRQRACSVNIRLLRRVAETLLLELAWPEDFALGIYLVARAEITRLNETFLRHDGPTDVITFDYGDSSRGCFRGTGRQECPDTENGRSLIETEVDLRGEIFICVEEALVQARRFRATLPLELTRYVIHGLLHLTGHDDLQAGPRRRMKRVENRLLRKLARRFDLKTLARPSYRPGGRPKL
jgi:probable rRNA maturation factor